MLRDLGLFVSTLVRTLVTFWTRGEAGLQLGWSAVAAFGLVSAFVAASISAEIEIWIWTGLKPEYTPWVAGLIAVLLTLLVGSFVVWREKVAKVRELERERIPEVRLTFYSPSDREVCLLIENTSKTQIEDCQVRLESYKAAGEVVPSGGAFQELANMETTFDIPGQGQAAVAIVWGHIRNNVPITVLGGNAKGVPEFGITWIEAGPAIELNLLVQAANLSPQHCVCKHDGYWNLEETLSGVIRVRR